ncbi:MAG: HNH endonuclease [Patescibacteria group bacterium]|nr:HNH endonuclease [Patescibacteria group bacterium]
MTGEVCLLHRLGLGHAVEKGVRVSSKAKRKKVREARKLGAPLITRVRRFLVRKYALPNSCPSVKTVAKIIAKETGWKLYSQADAWGMVVRYSQEVLKDIVVPKNKTCASRKERLAFYASDAWLRLRYAAIAKYGRKCMACGSTDKIHVDHIKPRSRFPELELELSNLQILCHDCNMGKSNVDYTDWRPGVSEDAKSLDEEYRAVMGRPN